MIMKTCLSTLAFVLFINFNLLSGGWVPKKGKGYFQIGEYTIFSQHYYSPSGEVIEITPTNIYVTSLYADYGLGKNWAVQLYLPFFYRQTVDAVQYTPPAPNVDDIEGDELNSVGDMDISAKYGIIQEGPFVLNVGLTLGIPTGTVAGGSAGVLQSGDGEFNQMLSVEAGYSFGSTPLFAQAMLGFNNRTEGFSEEIRWRLEVGYTLKKLIMIGVLDGVESLKNDMPTFAAGNGIFSNNIIYSSYTLKLLYNFTENWGVVGGFSGAFRGQNVLASPAFTLGVYYQL